MGKKVYKLNAYGQGWELIPYVEKYVSGGLAIELIDKSDGCAFATLTVWIDDIKNVEDKNCAFVDTNNCPWAKNFIEENSLGVHCGVGFSGYCMYPLYKFDLRKLNERK